MSNEKNYQNEDHRNHNHAQILLPRIAQSATTTSLCPNINALPIRERKHSRCLCPS